MPAMAHDESAERLPAAKLAVADGGLGGKVRELGADRNQEGGHL